MADLGIGVVGAGYWGPNLIRNFAAATGAELVAVCDQSEERLAPVGRAYPAARTTASFADLLRATDVGAIAVATPARTHFALTRDVIEAGKSAFVEKPLAMTASECEELIALAERRGVVLMVGHTFEYNAAVEYVEGLMRSGELGELYYLYSQRLNLGVVRQDVDALWNLAPHDVSIALRWLGEMPVAVNAQGYTYLQAGICDVVYLNLEFGSGVSVHVHVSWLDPGKVRRTTVVGSRKMVVYDDASTEAKIQVYDKGIDREHMGGSLGEFDTFGKFQLSRRAGDVLIPQIDFVEPLKRECQHFVDCAVSGSRPLTDGHSGLRVVRILEAATRSLSQGGANITIT